MAGGREYSRYQEGIIRRYFLHKGSIQIGRLQELVGALYLASGREADKLWATAEKTLRALETDPPIPPSRIEAVLASKDAAKLAELVGELDRR